MTPQEEIELLRSNVDKLLSRYADLQSQVGVLEAANRAQHEQLVKSHAELAELKKKYQDLQTAHSLTAVSEERERAKRQISSLIFKIDQTLELLKE